MDFHDAVKEYEKSVKPKRSKRSGICFKHNIKAHPGILHSIDDQGCYTWLRAKSFMWSGFVLGMIITLTFLPVRLIFYTYVSPNWLGNLGLLSLIAAMVFAIVYFGEGKKNLIGKFSMAYRQRMSRFVHHKRSIPVFLGMQFFMILIYTSVFYTSTEDVVVDPTPDVDEFNMSMAYTMLPIDSQYEKTVFDKVNNFDVNDMDENYADEIQGMMSSIFFNSIHSPETKEQMYDFYKDSRHSDAKFHNINESEIYTTLAKVPKSVNTVSDGWSSHFSAVWLIGDIEYTALFFTYRKIYKKVDVGLPWKAVDAWKSRRGGFLYPIDIIKERNK